MDLPYELVLEVLAFLSVKDIFPKIASTCSALNTLAWSPHHLQSVIYRDFKLNLLHPKPDVVRLLLRNAACFAPSQERVEFYGFATNGGVDVDMTYLWVRNMFEVSDKGYSTRDDYFNINCAAVLSSSLKIPDLKQGPLACLRRLESVLNVPPCQETDTVLDLLVALINLRSLLTAEHREFYPEYNNSIQDLMNYARPNVARLTQSSHLDLHLSESIDFDRVASSNQTCFIHGLKISREGNYTCPVASLVVIVSDSYIPVISPEFDRFNDLTSPAQVKMANEIDPSVPDTDTPVVSDEFTYIEFKPSQGPLQPVLWLRFSPGHLDEVSVTLSRRHSCKFMYVKLIDCENRKEIRGWMHPNTNIDIRHVLATGAVVSLDSS
jgi:hypothetical protein